MADIPKPRKPVTLSDQKVAECCARGRIVIIDDDTDFLSALTSLIELEGYACETYSSALAYLKVLRYNRPFPGPCCVLSDIKMPELDGLGLQERLAELDDTPLLLMSGSSTVHEAVGAFRNGALDFLIKPFDADMLLTAVRKALLVSTERQQQRGRRTDLAKLIASLTERERDIARRAASGQTNPDIAKLLGISLRTVKRYRQRAMEKIGADNTADLVRIALEGSL